MEILSVVLSILASLGTIISLIFTGIAKKEIRDLRNEIKNEGNSNIISQGNNNSNITGSNNSIRR